MTDKKIRTILKQIEQRYDLGSINVFHAHFLKGLAGDNFYIEAKTGRFVFKVLSTKVDARQADLIFNVLKFLEDFDVKTPRVFPTIDGEIGLRMPRVFKERIGILFSFIPIDFWPQNCMGAKYVREMADEVVRLHQALEKYPGSCGKEEESFLRQWRAILERINRSWAKSLWKSDRQKEAEGKKVITLATDFLSEIQDGIANCRKKQLIHGDFTKFNFLFYKGHLSGIVDFDEMSLGLVHDDWATFISCWFSPQRSALGWDDCLRMINEARAAQNVPMLDEEEMRARTIVYLLKLMLETLRIPRDENERRLFSMWYNEAVTKILFLI